MWIWIPLSFFKLSTQYPYYSQFFEYSVKNTLIDHTLIDHNACISIITVLANLAHQVYSFQRLQRLQQQSGAGGWLSHLLPPILPTDLERWASVVPGVITNTFFFAVLKTVISIEKMCRSVKGCEKSFAMIFLPAGLV